MVVKAERGCLDQAIQVAEQRLRCTEAAPFSREPLAGLEVEPNHIDDTEEVVQGLFVAGGVVEGPLPLPAERRNVSMSSGGAGSPRHPTATSR
jgi:hypothetical protein